MPWMELNSPSIQLGVLKALLESKGLPVESRSFYLRLSEFLLEKTSDCSADDAILVSDYHAVASRFWTVGLGDWIFAVPPFRPLTPRSDADYFAYLRQQRVPDATIAKAVQIREFVPEFLECCLADLTAASPGAVGFTTSFSQNVPSLVLAMLLKMRNPSMRVVFGGANCDGPMGAALHRSFPWIDVVVRGEAERVLPRLAEELLGGQPVTPQPGLCYRDGETSHVVEQGTDGLVGMDEIPCPDYNEYFQRLKSSRVRNLVSPRVTIPIESGRGCWWGQRAHCTFCGLNGSTMTFRSKSAERLSAEVVNLARRHRRLEFEAVDNILDHNYFETFLRWLEGSRREGWDLGFFYETKANLTKGQVRLLRDAGVHRIQAGLESLSNPILRLMRKGTSAMQNVRLLKWAAQYGVQVAWNIIYGIPGEPQHEYQQMASLVPSLVHLRPPSLVRLRVNRFSPYHSQPADYGLSGLRPCEYYAHIYPVDAGSLSDLAYDFEYEYVDGRHPEEYVKQLRNEIELWESSYFDGGANSLRFHCGPGFLRIEDRRPNLPGGVYSLGGTEARVYLSCDSGATAVSLWSTLQLEETGLTPEDLSAFLDGLVESRLMYRDRDRYLSLALPANADGEVNLESMR
jgi:ribosomal peptide maturation radical SAM protein 1